MVSARAELSSRAESGGGEHLPSVARLPHDLGSHPPGGAYKTPVAASGSSQSSIGELLRAAKIRQLDLAGDVHQYVGPLDVYWDR